MDSKNFITEKILDSMKNIFAFSKSRVANTTEAEDLSQQIITELLASRETLKDENAFYGWMWSVARNTYSKYIRSGKKRDFISIENDNYISDSTTDIEYNLVLKEDINILRREMSFLARQYREALIKYYIEEKSCVQISAELSVTVETVKHLLFKARKVLKEGINMAREYGEKSYKPDIFRFNMWVSNDAWEKYHRLFGVYETRKLPGNILLSTYYSPMTVEELSVELGVSAPYIEDELNIMLKNGLMILLPKARYQANIFIYTDSCDEEITAKTKTIYADYSKKLMMYTDELIPVFKESVFKDSDIPQNTLRWFVSHFIIWQATCKVQSKDNVMPLLPLGGRGYLWGHNYDSYERKTFNGIYGKRTSEHYSGWIHASNYTLLENCQVQIGGYQPKTDFLLAAAHKSFGRYSPDEIAQYIQWEFIEKNGDSLKSLCPVMTEAQYNEICGICDDSINEISAMFGEIVLTAANIMENHAPVAVKDHCRQIALINTNGMAEIMENLCENGYLMIPQKHSFLTIFAVI